MLAVFCLRLAAGMLACLLLLSPAQVHARFYRTHFLTALGLGALALFLAWDGAPWPLLLALGAGLALAFAGSFVWWLEGAPGGRALIVLTTLAFAAALQWQETRLAGPQESPAAVWAGGLASSLLLGSALTAMLLGHSYLISPGMSLTPLLRLLTVLAAALVVRAGADGFALWRWTEAHRWGNLRGDAVVWLPVRWGVGLLAPLVLGWMARESARIRSTQSATGILYVVVVFCFLGELTGQLLRESGLAL